MEEVLSDNSSPASSRSVTPAAKNPKRGRKSTAGAKKSAKKKSVSTPAPQSRASSVSSTAKVAASGRKGKKSKGSKSKSGAGGGYKETDYHYGSDFENHEYEKSESEKSSDSDLSDIESFSDDMKPESDVELEPNLIDDEEDSLPAWLDEFKIVPKLELPQSSDDLILTADLAFEAVTIYEVLRQFYNIIRLSPFRFEDFCAGM